MVSDATFCQLHNLDTLGYIILILYSYVEQVMTMCPVQEQQLSLSYFRSYLPLIISDAVLCPHHNLKTLRYIIMIFHSYVEHVLTMCRVQEYNSHFHTLWVISGDGFRCNIMSAP